MLNIEVGPFQPMCATLQTMVLAHAVELAGVRSAREVQDTALPAARDGIIEQRFEVETPKARLAKLLRATFGRLLEKLRHETEKFELTLTDVNKMLAKPVPPEPAAQEMVLIPIRRGRRPGKGWKVHHPRRHKSSRTDRMSNAIQLILS